MNGLLQMTTVIYPLACFFLFFFGPPAPRPPSPLFASPGSYQQLMKFDPSRLGYATLVL